MNIDAELQNMKDKISLIIVNLSNSERQKMKSLAEEYNSRYLDIEKEGDRWFIEKTNQILFPTKALTKM